MPERPEFWGIPKPLGSNIVYVLMALAAVILLVRFYKETRSPEPVSGSCFFHSILPQTIPINLQPILVLVAASK